MKIYRYTKFDEDVVDNIHQDYQLPDNYPIFPVGFGHRVWNWLARKMVAIVGWVLAHGYYHVHYVGKEKLHQVTDQGYFIYANHTQPVGDVFLPFNILPASRLYLIANQANWGVPVLGKLLVRYGGLPVGQNLRQSAKLIQAVRQVINSQGVVMIYPEAHVWPYYTQIRPFAVTSFNFPVALSAPAFTLTTTYHRPRVGKRPRIVVYIDGPFYPDPCLTKKAAQEKIYKTVRTTLKQRAQKSDYQYYQYVQKEKDEE